VIRLGLIGAGRWGRRYIETLSGVPGLALTAVASRNPETPALSGPRCKVFADWRELLAAGGLDGLIVATPPALHAEMAAAALQAGLPVLVEKPLTMDLEQAKSLLALAQKKKGSVIVGHTHLFSAAYAALRAKAPELGRLLRLSTAGGNHGPFREGIGPLWDYAPHDVAFCLDLTGEKPLSAAGQREASPPSGPGENLRLALGFREGVSAEIRVGNLFPEKRRLFEAGYEKGTLTIDDLKRDKLTFRPLSGPAQSVPLDEGEPLQRQLRAFSRSIESGSRDLSTLRLGVSVVEVLSACQRTLNIRV
jgi:predicted dehydrogenase